MHVAPPKIACKLLSTERYGFSAVRLKVLPHAKSRAFRKLGSYEFYTYKRVGTSLTAHVDPFVVISDFEHSFIWHRNRQCRGPWACVLTRD